jgi:catechol 2,3-dioxygenase-like lactoylglutathione lyase family enzyme
MKGGFNHIQYNIVAPEKTLPFYKDLLGYFEMQTLYEGDGMLGMGDGHMSIWFLPPQGEKKPFDRDAGGLNHLGIHVESAAAVDRFYSEFMKPHGIASAFDTPRARPEFSPHYYQVMFVDPEGCHRGLSRLRDSGHIMNEAKARFVVGR